MIGFLSNLEGDEHVCHSHDIGPKNLSNDAFFVFNGFRVTAKESPNACRCRERGEFPPFFNDLSGQGYGEAFHNHSWRVLLPGEKHCLIRGFAHQPLPIDLWALGSYSIHKPMDGRSRQAFEVVNGPFEIVGIKGRLLGDAHGIKNSFHKDNAATGIKVFACLVQFAPRASADGRSIERDGVHDAINSQDRSLRRGNRNNRGPEGTWRCKDKEPRYLRRNGDSGEVSINDLLTGESIRDITAEDIDVSYDGHAWFHLFGPTCLKASPPCCARTN